MPQESCQHAWEMVHVVPGFIVTEKCFECGKVANYFSAEKRPPLDEYREGEHFWNVMGSDQSIRFDLECAHCKRLVTFENLLGVLMCTGCDKNCEAGKLFERLEGERTWVYVAFGYLPVGETKQLTPEQVAILEEYFNQRRKSSRSRIKIVSHELVRDVLACYGDIIRDVEMLSLTPPAPSPQG